MRTAPEPDHRKVEAAVIAWWNKKHPDNPVPPPPEPPGRTLKP